MRLIVVGCGSIGSRHARNASSLGAEIVLCDLNLSRMIELAQELGAVATYQDFSEAAEKSKATAAVIATPTNLHFQPAKIMLEAGIHVLMEKPLCHSIEDAKKLEEISKISNAVFMMAHTYRFRSEWQEVKHLVDNQILGHAYSAEFAGGWYLPDWHIREDYRKEYAAQKQLGGGVLLTSLSHFFDIVNWFFGEIDEVSGARMRLSKLEINVDDSVVCTLKTVNGVGVTLIEDFLSRCPRRTFRLNAEHGYLQADFNRKTIEIWDARKKRMHPDEFPADMATDQYFRILEDGVMYDLIPDILPLRYSGNDAYKAEMAFFMNAVTSGQAVNALGIDAGIQVMSALNHAGLCDWTHEH